MTPARLTPDATYNGLPLTRTEYDASLEMLRHISGKGWVSAWFSTTLDDVSSRAMVALQQAGILYTYGANPMSPQMTWNRIALSAYGDLYLAQRETRDE